MTLHNIPPQLLLDHLLNATTDTAIAVVDPDFKLNYLNPFAIDLFHCTPEVMVGRSIRDIHFKSQRSREHFDQAVDRIKSGEAFEYLIEQDTDDGVRYLGIRISGCLGIALHRLCLVR